MGLWVDTDFGFDDLWALCILRDAGLVVDGVTLVAGNTPLPRVIANAHGARAVLGFEWPLFAGEARPLIRPPETAERILGTRGMQSRGAHLPDLAGNIPLPSAEEGIAGWLSTPTPGDRTLLALGPLTNVALFSQKRPDLFARLTRIVWMGGSAGPGNHSLHAEFNALADPHAVAQVLSTGIPMQVVDLEACRAATFGEADLPVFTGVRGALLADLLGGYLDIALTRGRSSMAIYDPLVALALARPELVVFSPMAMSIETGDNAFLGHTSFVPDPAATGALATRIAPDAALLCLAALQRDTNNV